MPIIVKIKKHRGASVPSYYVSIVDVDGTCRVLLASDAVGWWTKDEAKRASVVWLREQLMLEEISDAMREALVD